jgi:hypothetical protein
MAGPKPPSVAVLLTVTRWVQDSRGRWIAVLVQEPETVRAMMDRCARADAARRAAQDTETP